MKPTKKMDVRVPISAEEYAMLMNYCTKMDCKYSEALRPVVNMVLNNFDTELAATGQLTLNIKYSLKCEEYITIYLKLRQTDYARLQSYADRAGMSCAKMVRYTILPTLHEYVD